MDEMGLNWGLELEANFVLIKALNMLKINWIKRSLDTPNKPSLMTSLDTCPLLPGLKEVAVCCAHQKCCLCCHQTRKDALILHCSSNS
jgi:hypothetical protein